MGGRPGRLRSHRGPPAGSFRCAGSRGWELGLLSEQGRCGTRGTRLRLGGAASEAFCDLPRSPCTEVTKCGHEGFRAIEEGSLLTVGTRQGCATQGTWQSTRLGREAEGAQRVRPESTLWFLGAETGRAGDASHSELSTGGGLGHPQRLWGVPSSLAPGPGEWGGGSTGSWVTARQEHGHGCGLQTSRSA